MAGKGEDYEVEEESKLRELRSAKQRLIAEAKLLKIQQNIQRQELFAEQQRKALKMQETMAQLALEMARAGEEDGEDLDVSSASLIVYATDINDPEVLLRMKPPEPSSSPNDGMNKLLESLVHSTQQQQQHVLDAIQMPTAQLIMFDGDPMQYHMFMTMFDNNVDRSTVDSASKLARLMQYCNGPAKQVIMCCAAMIPDDGYKRARQLLKERFGNSAVVTQTWVEKITAGGTIHPNDGPALLRLADDLNNCVETLSAIGYINEINNQAALVQITSRLPTYLQHRWRKEVADLRKRSKYPTIDDVSGFVRAAALEANDPVYGKIYEASKRVQPVNDVSSKRFQPKRSTSLVTTTEGKKRSEGQARGCAVCAQQHPVWQCDTFKSASVPDRFRLAKEKRLCYNCLKPNHMTEQCNSTHRCTVPDCGEKHSNYLHRVSPTADAKNNGDKTTEVKQITNGHVTGTGNISTGTIALPVVPVIIGNNSSNKFVRAFALLDSGSTHSFCSSSIARMLELSERQETLSLTTLEKVDSKIRTTVVSLDVSSLNGQGHFKMPSVYTKDKLQLTTTRNMQDVKQWPHLRDIALPSIDCCSIDLLIGQDCPQALIPLEVRSLDDVPDAPYAVRTILGWAVNGPLGSQTTQKVSSHFAFVQDGLEQLVERFWKVDTPPECAPDLSFEDKRAVTIWKDTLTHKNGHYQVAIPFKDGYFGQRKPTDCKAMALKRLGALKARLTKDENLHMKYRDYMNDLLRKGYAEVVHQQGESDVTWYLPHHPVFNENKPGKVRVVFDCAAKVNGKSLNDWVLQGPDLTNTLIGVLLRFRLEPVALMADIEAMFHQVGVTEGCRDALRFLWWDNGDFSKDPIVHRMTVHLFGGVWSPSCCNFILRRTAEDNAEHYDKVTVDTVMSNFYVDDCLKAVPDIEQAKKLVIQLRELLHEGGFKLTKWVSNEPAALEALSEEEHSKGNKCVNLDANMPLVERALGIKWNVEIDSLCYSVTNKNKPHTRRGLLSAVCSIYDPMGHLSPCLLIPKKIIQELHRKKIDWDDALPEPELRAWQEFTKNLPKLENMSIIRCVKPISAHVTLYQLHHFSDASQVGYGAVSYLRMTDENGNVSCKILMAKSRLAPLKQQTIPRLELCAATVAVKLDTLLRRELSIKVQPSVFWTDSSIVLHYICSDELRLQTFVANRVTQIREHSEPSQWHYVDTANNPADDVSRGLSADELLTNERWFEGPSFLKLEEEHWPRLARNVEMTDVVDVHEMVYTTQAGVPTNDVFDRLFLRRSSWYRLMKDVAWMLRAKAVLRSKAKKEGTGVDMTRMLSISELEEAKLCIVRIAQWKEFASEISLLDNNHPITKTSKLHRLEPILSDGVLRVGGRLRSHPMILSQFSAISKLIVLHHHTMSCHAGKEQVMAALRQEFWIIGVRSLVRKVLNDCRKCRKLYSHPLGQRMADLPTGRLVPYEPPFSCVGVDVFGPFLVRRGRSDIKRYGCLFTCLRCRAIHIEVLATLESDAFINALQRFICRRGQVKEIRSDNGTNFVGAQRELSKAISEWNQTKIEGFLQQKSIQWTFNPPAASHMGGVWERLIRSVRKVLATVMQQQNVTEEGLATVFCLVEQVVNSRPLTTTSTDHRDPEPITPNHLLTLKGSTPPPGEFDRTDQFRQSWRQAQYLANVFWTRWRREYLPTLQLRQKWLNPVRNLRINDVTIIADDNSPRNEWRLGRVMETYSGTDGLVRSVKLKTKAGFIVRPVHKLCLLETAE